MRNKKIKSTIIVGVMLLSVMLVFAPSASATFSHAIFGTIYVDGVIAESGLQINVDVPDIGVSTTEPTESVDENGYNFYPGFDDGTYSGKTIYFTITGYDGEYSVTLDQSTESVEVYILDTMYFTATSSGDDDDDDVIPPDDDDDVTPSDDDDDVTPSGDDDDDSGGGGGNGGSGGSSTSDDVDSQSSGSSGPNADASLSEIFGSVGGEVNFDGSLSTGTGTLTYSWNFGDETTGTGMTTIHTYGSDGTYTITLTVTDSVGSDTDTVQVFIAVGNTPPTDPVLTGEQAGTQNTEYTYTATSTDADNDTIKYTFVWGDGSNSTTTDFTANNTAASAVHTWTAAGIYNIQVTANDNQTDSGSTTYKVLVDVIELEYNGTDVGYIIDNDSDGTYDMFNDGAQVENTITKQEDGTYLIDSDDDGTPDYVYDAETDTLTLYSSPETEGDNTLLYAAVALFLIIILLGAGYYYMTKNKKQGKDKNKPKNKKK